MFIKYDDDHVEEAVLELDTLVVDLEKGLLKLGWRGVVNVADEDMLDASYALIGSEPIDAPNSDEYWRPKLDEFTAAPLGLKEAGMLDADSDLAADADAAPIDVKPDGEGTPMQAFMKQQMGDVQPDMQAQIEQHLNEAAKGWASGGGMPQGFNESIASGLGNASQAPPSPHMAIGMVLTRLATMKTLAAQHGLDTAKIDEAMNHPQMKQFTPEGMEPKADFPADGVDKPGTPDAYKDASAPGDGDASAAGGTGAAAGQTNYSGHDFSGQDLTARDFSNCKLVGCNFSKANIAGVSFVGSDLSNAVLFEATADGADFTDATMEAAICDRASMAGAVFLRTQLKNAGFDRAKLPGAVLDEAKCERTRFTRCDLTAASAAQMQGDITLFDSSTMPHVNFEGATLYKASFHFATATDQDFTNADLRELQGGMECDFSRSRFENTLAGRSIWRGAKMHDVKILDSDLSETLLVEADLTGAMLQRTDLAKSMMRKACLTRAQFFECRLMRAELPKVVADNATFLDCNMWQAVLIDADLETCTFSNSPLDHSIRRDS